MFAPLRARKVNYDVEGSKKYANEFLEQIKTLKEPDMTEIKTKLEQCAADIARLEEEKTRLENLQKEESKIKHGDILASLWGNRVALYDSAGQLYSYGNTGKKYDEVNRSWYHKTGKNIFENNMLGDI